MVVSVAVDVLVLFGVDSTLLLLVLLVVRCQSSVVWGRQQTATDVGLDIETEEELSMQDNTKCSHVAFNGCQCG